MLQNAVCQQLGMQCRLALAPPAGSHMTAAVLRGMAKGDKGRHHCLMQCVGGMV